MANIWVTGADGQLGSAFRACRFSVLDELFFTDRELDIADAGSVTQFIEAHEIDTILNCAAYTAVDRAEAEPEEADRINRLGAKVLAEASLQLGCLLVHFSTDYVFDGTQQTPYTERDEAHPQTVYGLTKKRGEQAIRKSGCLALIIRTGWLYYDTGSNFVRTMLRLAESGDEIRVVNDQWGSPTYAADLAEAVVRILDEEDPAAHAGVYHYTNEGVCSWYEFAREIFSQAGLSVNLKPVSTAEYPTAAVRPAFSVLDKRKIKETFHLTIPTWPESLRRCLSVIF